MHTHTCVDIQKRSLIHIVKKSDHIKTVTLYVTFVQPDGSDLKRDPGLGSNKLSLNPVSISSVTTVTTSGKV